MVTDDARGLFHSSLSGSLSLRAVGTFCRGWLLRRPPLLGSGAGASGTHGCESDGLRASAGSTVFSRRVKVPLPPERSTRADWFVDFDTGRWPPMIEFARRPSAELSGGNVARQRMKFSLRSRRSAIVERCTAHSADCWPWWLLSRSSKTASKQPLRTMNSSWPISPMWATTWPFRTSRRSAECETPLSMPSLASSSARRLQLRPSAALMKASSSGVFSQTWGSDGSGRLLQQ
mmetsp:Transcript_28640/g.72478  ORF Transcript_28640/g.72478 Transcript_28640/m.72478 type:complete len:233 (-) Transcript_28640:630-1328(-)